MESSSATTSGLMNVRNDRPGMDSEVAQATTRDFNSISKDVQDHATTTIADEPPNGGYGWVCVASCAALNAHTWGINSSYGVFLAEFLSTNAFPGATSLDYALIGGLSVAVAMLTAPIATVCTRKFGTRITLFVGIFFQTLSLIGASFTKQIWQLFLAQGGCFGIGMGFLFVGSVGIPAQWFTTRRSLANGICAAGSGLGGLTYSLAAGAIIRTRGLGWAFRVLGIVSCGVNTVCALLLRDRTAKIGSAQLAFDYTLFRRMEFDFIQAWGFLSLLAYVVVLFSLPNYASTIGLTPHQGSVINAVLQLGQMCGRPPIGYFSDSFGRINMAMTMTFLAGLFCLVIWIFAKSYGVLILFAFIGGTVAGTFWTTVAPVAAEVVGLKELPSALSITWLMLVIPSTFSEAIGLEIAERTNAGYLGTQLFAGFVYIGAALCLLPIRAWKIGQLERGAINEKLDGKALAESPFLVRMVAFRKV